MKNKEDASKAKSDEYLAFEALAKRIITNNKDVSNKQTASKRGKPSKPAPKPSKP